MNCIDGSKPPAYILLAFFCFGLACSGQEKISRESVEGPSPGVEIAPYLLSLQPTSVSVSWVTPLAIRSKIQLSSIYGTSERTDKSTGYFHEISFEDLEPATRYAYLVDGVHAGDFRTPSEADSFSVVAIGHTHGTEVSHQYPDELLISKVRDFDPDFVLHSGDITYYSTLQDFSEFYFRPMHELAGTVPVYVSPGNHDSGWPPRNGFDFRNFRKLFPRDYGSKNGAYFSFEFKNAKFVALSYVNFDSEQRQWLRRELDQSEKEFNIVFLGGSQITEAELAEFFELFSEHRVDAVFGGDGSGFFQKNISGVPYFYSGIRGGKPAGLHYLRFEPYTLTVMPFSGDGVRKGKHQTIKSQVQKETVQNLTDIKPNEISVSPRQGSTAATDRLRLDSLGSSATISFKGLSNVSSEYDGLRVTATCLGDNLPARFRVRWKPKESGEADMYQGEGTMRMKFYMTQPFSLPSGESKNALIDLPKKDPYTGRFYELDELRLESQANRCPEGFLLEEVSLIRD